MPTFHLCCDNQHSRLCCRSMLVDNIGKDPLPKCGNNGHIGCLLCCLHTHHLYSQTRMLLKSCPLQRMSFRPTLRLYVVSHFFSLFSLSFSSLSPPFLLVSDASPLGIAHTPLMSCVHFCQEKSCCGCGRVSWG